MLEPFDPSISSSGYLALARKRHQTGTSRLSEDLAWMLDDEAYNCGLNKEHVDMLTDPANWSATLRDENRKPRVFLDARINQRGYAEINWARGDLEILYDEDFLANYAATARSPNAVSGRGLGELMWWRRYELLVSNVTINRSPTAQALLYAHGARLNELTSFLASRVNLVGAMALTFTYRAGAIVTADFVPTISFDQLHDFVQERGQRKVVRMREAVERIVPKE
ncbi:hypothetical protein FJ934_16540 [Mesorhizobium sp. B2-4-12]|uniref:hypothetical protein n=1 Tax=Mesorhizobium sp. B2-4-12 TaxID=2589937 RepID=UPI0011265876|nr:hypothetical protein [Mesorhizobium sp. B2-4-12]TPK93890.1 hypothetical protein FJ934_16540 [Mesorhizobium sp. B2-4-12]